MEGGVNGRGEDVGRAEDTWKVEKDRVLGDTRKGIKYIPLFPRDSQ